MRKILIKDGVNQAKLVRTSQYSQIDQERVRSIVDDVKKSGDKAIKNYTMKFDNVNIESLKVTEEETNMHILKLQRHRLIPSK